MREELLLTTHHKKIPIFDFSFNSAFVFSFKSNMSRVSNAIFRDKIIHQFLLKFINRGMQSQYSSEMYKYRQYSQYSSTNVTKKCNKKHAKRI